MVQRLSNEKTMIVRIEKIKNITSAPKFIMVALASAWLLAQIPSHAANAINSQLERLNIDIQRTQKTKSALKNAEASLLARMKILRRDLILVANDLQNQEIMVSRLEAQLNILQNNLNQQETEIIARHRQISEAINLFSRYTDVSLPIMLLQAENPDQIIQGAVVVASVLPQLSDRARLLEQNLKALGSLRGNIEENIVNLSKNQQKLNLGKERLEILVNQNLKQVQETQKNSKVNDAQLAKLVNEAGSLNELVAGLKAAKAVSNLKQKAKLAPLPPPITKHNANKTQPDALIIDQPESIVPETATIETATIETAAIEKPILLRRPEGIRSFPTKGKKLASPVSGDLIVKYGDALQIGGKSRGIELSARSEAQVVTPYDGKIVFAGSFREFGLVVIVEHDGGYHSVLAGLHKLSVVPEQWVLAGEPIGRLAQRGLDNKKPKLYVELRRDGNPINPLPFLEQNRIKS